MQLISGFLALCSAVGAGSATEIAATGYARQAISFGNAVNGVTVNDRGFDFGSVGISSSVGRAIFDAPAGGNLLVVMPHAAPRLPQGGSIDRGEAGDITLILTTLAGYPDGAAYNGTFAAAAALGLCYDRDEVIGLVTTAPNAVAGVAVLQRGGGQFLRVNASVLTVGVALTVTRGMLRAT